MRARTRPFFVDSRVRSSPPAEEYGVERREVVFPLCYVEDTTDADPLGCAVTNHYPLTLTLKIAIWRFFNFFTLDPIR